MATHRERRGPLRSGGGGAREFQGDPCGLRRQGCRTSADRILTAVTGTRLRGVFALSLVVGALVAAPGVLAQEGSPRVLAVHLANDINPVTQEFVADAVDRAEDGEYAAMVLVLDTPGG